MPRPQPHTHPLIHLVANILGKTLGTVLSVLYNLPSVLYFEGEFWEKVENTHFPPEDVAYSWKIQQTEDSSVPETLPSPKPSWKGRVWIICGCGSTTKHYLNFPFEEKDGCSTPENEHFLAHCDWEDYLFLSALELMGAQLPPQAHPGWEQLLWDLPTAGQKMCSF